MRVICVAVALGFAGASAQAFAVDLGEPNEVRAYWALHAGLAQAAASVGDVQEDFDAVGVGATVQAVDGERVAWGTSMGYRIFDSLAVEAAYLDLGQVDVQYASAESISNLDDAHPGGGSGVSLVALFRYRFNDEWQIRARGGAFYWQAEYQSIGHGGAVVKVKADGTDGLWGFGIGYHAASRLALVTDIIQFEFDRHPTALLRFGVEVDLY